MRATRLAARWMLFTFCAQGLSACASAPAAEPAEPSSPATADNAVSEPAPANAAPRAQGSSQRLRQLEDAATREQAVQQLLKDYQQAAQHGSKTESAQSFIAYYAEALANAYVAGHASLAKRTRVQLITVLTSFDDVRTVPAHVHALKVYAESGQGVDEAIWACQAAQRLKHTSFGDPLLAAFDAIDMPNKDSRRLSVHLAKALQYQVNEAWAPALEAKLKPSIVRPEAFNDAPAVKAYQNQVYWQTTASTLLGLLRQPSAARPLAQVLLSNDKSDVHESAELAFVRVGKPAVELASSLLTGADAALVQQAKSARGDVPQAHVYFATRWLTLLAHPSSEASLLAAWESQAQAQSRVLIVRALTALPRSSRAVELFKQTLASVPSNLTLPEGESGMEVLIESSPYFFDPELVPFLADRAGKVPGGGNRKGDAQRALIMAVAKLVLPAQVDKANKASQAYGGNTGTPAFEAAVPMARECQTDAGCYARKLETLPENTDTDAVLLEKAAIGVGAFGKTEQRAALLARLPRAKSLRLRATLLRAIDQLSPKADANLDTALQQLITQSASATDPAEVAARHQVELLKARVQNR